MVYFVNLKLGSFCNAILNAKYNKYLYSWGMHFHFLSSLLRLVLVLVCLLVALFSTLSLVLWLDSLPGIILDICE